MATPVLIGTGTLSGSSGTITTTAIAPAGSKLILTYWAGYNATAAPVLASVSDNSGNGDTWVVDATGQNGKNNPTSVGRCDLSVALPSGTTITVNAAQTVGPGGGVALYYVTGLTSGVLTTASGKGAAAVVPDAGPTAAAVSGSVFAVSVCAISGAQTQTAGGGCTLGSLLVNGTKSAADEWETLTGLSSQTVDLAFGGSAAGIWSACTAVYQVSSSQSLTPPVATHPAAAHGATITASGHAGLSPPRATHAAAAHAPVIDGSGHASLTPPIATHAATGYTPSLSEGGSATIVALGVVGQHNDTGTGSTEVCKISTSVPAGAVLVICANMAGGKVLTGVQDSHGTTYPVMVAQAGTSNACSANIAVGVTPVALAVNDQITLTYSGTASSGGHCSQVLAFTGVTASNIVDGFGSHALASGTSTAFDSGATETTIQADEVAIAMFAWKGGSANKTLSGWTAGYTTSPLVYEGSGNYLSLATAYLVVSAKGVQEAKATLSGGGSYSAGAIVTLKAAASAVASLSPALASHAAQAYNPLISGLGGIRGQQIKGWQVPDVGLFYFGADDQYGFTVAPNGIEYVLGRKMAIRNQHHQWGQAFDQAAFNASCDDPNITPMVTWGSQGASFPVYPGSGAPSQNTATVNGQQGMNRIAAGEFDASMLKPLLDILTAAGQPVLLRPWQEMDAPAMNCYGGYQGGIAGGVGQASYIAGFQHLHDYLEANYPGNQVLLIWCPTAYDPDNNKLTYEPDPSKYHLVGLDVYRQAPWGNIDDQYNLAVTRNKPFLVCEAGFDESVKVPAGPGDPGGPYSKDGDVAGTSSLIDATMNQLAGSRYAAYCIGYVTWNDTAQKHDNRVNTSPGSLAQYKAWATSLPWRFTNPKGGGLNPPMAVGPLVAYPPRLSQGGVQGSLVLYPPLAESRFAAYAPGLATPTQKPTYTLEADWKAINTGIFTIGYSAIGGTDVLGSQYEGNPQSVLPALNVSVQRGRSDSSSVVQAGQMSFALLDSNGTYNPLNTASPLYGLIKPMRPMRLQGQYAGVTYDLFNGFLVNLYDDPRRSVQQATGLAHDGFEWLSSTPVIESTGVTTTGAAIGLLLDSAYWPSGARILDVGDTIPDFSTDGTQTVLQWIGNLLQAEQGWAFIDAHGNFVYQSRHHADSAASQVTLTDQQVQSILPGVDVSGVYNRATVTGADGIQQQAFDQASIDDYGLRDLPAISSPYIANATQAYQLALYLVSINKDPQPPVWTLQMMVARDPTVTTQVLARDLGDVVTLSDSFAGTTGDYVIEGIQHSISPQQGHQVSWTLAPRRRGAFTIGRSTIGGGDALTY